MYIKLQSGKITGLINDEYFPGSGLIHGIGPSIAALIITAFGEDTMTETGKTG